jgi:diguanylate cyclase
LDVIAEGVEEQEQLHFLKEKGCTFVQGYLIGKPVAAEEFRLRWLG